MDGDRTARALGRIEVALQRVEAAAQRPAATSGADDGLAERHARLRDDVTRSLAQLDALIGEAR